MQSGRISSVRPARSPILVFVMTMALALVGLVGAPHASAAAETSTLYAGETLVSGQRLVSASGALVLTMQGDGNVVLIAPGTNVRWQTGTNGYPGASLTLQGDGNLVVYAPGNVPVWNSFDHGGTAGGNRLVLQDDGNLVIYSGQTSTWISASYYFTDSLYSPDSLAAAGTLQSPNGAYNLKLQTDGNMVLRSADGQWLWHTNTADSGATRLTVQGDGNLVLYTSANVAVWQSGSYGSGAGVLRVQDDGNVVYYLAAGGVGWNSNGASNLVRRGSSVTDISGQVSAQALLASGRVSGGSEPIAQIQAVANGTALYHMVGSENRPCTLDPVILRSLKVMVVDRGASIYVTSFNRWCINDYSGVGANSYHWVSGGGHAVDLGRINGSGQASSAAMTAFAQQWVNVVQTPAGIGQSQCRSTPITLPTGVSEFTDTCNHLHLEYRG